MIEYYHKESNAEITEKVFIKPIFCNMELTPPPKKEGTGLMQCNQLMTLQISTVHQGLCVESLCYSVEFWAMP